MPKSIALPTCMQALLLTDDGPVVRTDYPIPKPGRGQVLVKVHMAGICATDLQLMLGYKGGYQGVLGHEFVGTVVAAPSNGEWMGRRVVAEINEGCGACDLCRRGLAKHCPQRRAMGIHGWDGAFAEFVAVPVANLHPVPPELADAQAVFTEPLAAALQVLEQVHITPASRVYVLGDGRLGNLVAQVVARTGCNLTVIGRHPAKLMLLQQLGIDTAIANNDADLIGLQAHPADVVVEVTGRAKGVLTAYSLVRPGGVVILKSTVAEPVERLDLSHLTVSEITVIGSRCGPFGPALRLLAAGSVVTDPLVHARYSLDEGIAALEHAGRRGVMKVLIEMGES